MPNFNSLLSGNMPEAFRIHLFNALESRCWTDAARKSASGLKSASIWFGLAAFTTFKASKVLESVVADSAPALPA